MYANAVEYDKMMPGMAKSHAKIITKFAPLPSSAANNINGTANINKKV
jgi:hypothetical protein